MQLFQRMTVFQRIMSAFAVVLAMTCGMGGFALFELARVGDATRDIKDNWMPSVRHSLEMKSQLNAYRTSELQHVLSASEEEFRRYEALMGKQLDAFRDAEKIFASLLSTEAERLTYREMMALMTQYLAVHDKLLALSRSGDRQGAVTMLRGESFQVRSQLEASIDKAVQQNVTGSEASGTHVEQVFASARNLMIGALLTMAVLVVALALVLARGLVRQLGGEPAYAAQVAGEVAAGNLALEVVLKPGDTSSMLHAMNRMRLTLADIVHHIKASSEAVAAASGQVAQGNVDLSQRTEEQASALEQTAASIEELAVTVRQNADNAGHADKLAQSASSLAEKGGQVVGDVVSTMGDISSSSGRIVDIISVIEGIAFQTNILALNAAVEAARAGEQGRGFAVVAGEVRSLAQRSASAAREIKELIEGSVSKVQEGSALVDSAGQTMHEIVEAVRQVSQLVADISAASTEQTSGIEQVNAAVTQIDDVTQQNAALVEEAAAAATALDEQSRNLLSSVAVFRLSARRGASHSSDTHGFGRGGVLALT
ncbi:methyl-accepting chemotaxis protein [Cupriavidus sp. D384]|uniref:methyl-accepting chemotaxis protein n=1 Tax=Cupriavidus sp. D384 TaxID=1538095 RepID=UPI0009EDE546|nr:methyl-accepting chemotaxis protein [Cupriavidus sp. D384]